MHYPKNKINQKTHAWFAHVHSSCSYKHTHTHTHTSAYTYMHTNTYRHTLTKTLRLQRKQTKTKHTHAHTHTRTRHTTHDSMPLFHIGGLSASVLATLSVGASLVCMNSFQPKEFVEQLSLDPQPTWYWY